MIAPIPLLAGVIAYGLAANAFYTLGWVSELLWSAGDTARTAPLRGRVFGLGVVASLALTLLPAVAALALWAAVGLR